MHYEPASDIAYDFVNDFVIRNEPGGWTNAFSWREL